MAAETSIGYYEGPTETVIAALIAARFDGAVLELEGEVIDDLEAIMETINAAYPELADGNRRASEALRIGPVGFGIGPHRIPIEGDNLDRLRTITDPGFITELAVHDDHGELVHASDVSDGEIWVADRVPADAVERMRAVLADGLRPPLRMPDDPS
jgi:hypothetical protein